MTDIVQRCFTIQDQEPREKKTTPIAQLMVCMFQPNWCPNEDDVRGFIQHVANEYVHLESGVSTLGQWSKWSDAISLLVQQLSCEMEVDTSPLEVLRTDLTARLPQDHSVFEILRRGKQNPSAIMQRLFRTRGWVPHIEGETTQQLLERQHRTGASSTLDQVLNNATNNKSPVTKNTRVLRNRTIEY